MIYKYLALNPLGKYQSGYYSGDKNSAISSLKDRQLQVISFGPDFFQSVMEIVIKKELSSKVLASFFEDLLIYIKTDLGISRTLGLLVETTNDKKYKKVMNDMLFQLQKGESLTVAMEYTQAFPWLAISTISSGEKSGRLPETLDVLAKYFKRQHEIKSKLIKSSIYPAVVLSIIMGLVFFISFQVVPAFKNILPEGALNKGPAKIMTSIADFLMFSWPVLIPAIIGLIMYLIFLFNKQPDWFMKILYRVPILGDIFKESALGYYFLNLSILNSSGIALTAALYHIINKSHGGHVIGHFKDCYKLCADKGHTFCEALGKISFFPTNISLTIKKGEDNGKLSDYLGKVASFFNDRVNQKVDAVLGCLQPVLIIFCAGILILLGMAFIQPIYSNLTNIAGGPV